VWDHKWTYEQREKWVEACPTFEDLICVYLDIYPSKEAYVINAGAVLEGPAFNITQKLIDEILEVPACRTRRRFANRR
jgi:hypothetical protein